MDYLDTKKNIKQSIEPGLIKYTTAVLAGYIELFVNNLKKKMN
ncbi:MAG: hypothetical protein AB8V46_01300 [Candidatus Midichloria sp.]